MRNEVLTYFLSSTFITGAIVYLLKMYIDKVTKKADEKQKQREKDRAELRVLEWQCESTLLELLRQVNRGIAVLDPDHEVFNGEYKKAYEAYRSAIAEKEKFIQTIFAQKKF